MKIDEVAINYIQLSVLLVGFIQCKHKYDQRTVVTNKTTDNACVCVCVCDWSPNNVIWHFKFN